MKLNSRQKMVALAGAWSGRDELRSLLLRRYWRQRSHFDLDFAGIRAKFSTTDFYSNYWFYGPQTIDAVYEPAVTCLLIRKLSTARGFVDVGANLGYFSVVAGVARPELPVFSFEMDETLRPIIQHNLEINHLGNVSVISSAVGNEGGPVSYVPHPFSFLAKIAGEKIDPYPLRFSAPVVRLDDYFLDKDIEPNLVKMDIDGAEMEALRGMTSLLEQTDMELLLEVHYHHLPQYGSSSQEVEQFLKERGFRFFQISDFRKNLDLELKEIPNLNELRTPSGDMLLVSRSSNENG